jgi:S-adenosyl-L-methionine methyltransferase
MLLAQGGLAVSDLPLDHPHLLKLPLPEGVAEGRYRLYRRR